jgi:hypothetical protein
VKHIHQNPRLGAFGERQGFRGPALVDEQANHGVVGGDFGFKEALLLFSSPRDVCAQGLDDGDGFFNGWSCLGRLVESAVGGPGRESGFPESVDVADLPSQA